MKKLKYYFTRENWSFSLSDINVVMINDGQRKCFVTAFFNDISSDTSVVLKEEIPVFLALEDIDRVVDYLLQYVLVDAKLVSVEPYYDYDCIKEVKLSKLDNQLIINDVVEVFEIVDLFKKIDALKILDQLDNKTKYKVYFIEFIFENNDTYNFVFSKDSNDELKKVIAIIEEYL